MNFNAPIDLRILFALQRAGSLNTYGIQCEIAENIAEPKLLLVMQRLMTAGVVYQDGTMFALSAQGSRFIEQIKKQVEGLLNLLVINF